MGICDNCCNHGGDCESCKSNGIPSGNYFVPKKGADIDSIEHNGSGGIQSKNKEE